MTVASGCKYDGSNYRENSVFLNLKAMNKYIAGTVSFIYFYFFSLESRKFQLIMSVVIIIYHQTKILINF